MSTDHINVDEVIVLLRRAGLIPDQWDVATIAGKASRWIADNLLDLSLDSSAVGCNSGWRIAF